MARTVSIFLSLLSVMPLAALADAPAALQDSVPAAQRSSFVKRVLNYFEQANVDKTLTKKFDFSVIGGPNYSTNTGFGIGLVAAGLYRIDRTDLTMPPSNASLFADVSTTGFFMIGIRGNNLFKEQKHRLDYTFYFSYKPTYFWGVGWDAATYNPRSEYTRLETSLEVNFMWRVAKNTYVGISSDCNYIIGRDVYPDYVPPGEGTTYTNIGLGGLFVYDSRDLINNAYRGLYIKLDQRFYPEFLANKTYFSRSELFIDYYHHAWRGAVMAYDLHMQFNRGDAPWTMLAELGSPYRMRGYYQGQYRDNGIMEIQAELRQKIHGRNGVAVWVGAGNVFPSVSDFNGAHTLPNYGLGYRWEFKKRVNVRLDYGFGKGQSGFIFNINEAF